MSIPVPQTAMVLAAGMGSRMKPLTDAVPKPLIKVGDKTLLDRALDPLVEAGVKRVIVNVHWLADQIEAHMSARSDVKVVISDERGERLETGGGLAKARGLLGDDPVFVINTDAFFAPESAAPYKQLAERFNPKQMDVLLLLARRDRSLGFPGPGDFFPTKTGGVTFRGEAERAPLVYAGTRIIRPQIYDTEAVRAFSAVEVWRHAIESRRLQAHVYNEFWLHVGTPDAVKDAEFWLMCHGMAPPKWTAPD